MTAALRLVLVAALVPAAGCDLFGAKCLDGPTGCALPGTWTLVAVDGTPDTGSLEINDGQFDRGGYARLPLSATERLAAPFSGTYTDEDNQYRLTINVTQADGALWRADVYAQPEISGSTLTLRLGSVRVPEGIVTVNSRYPKLKAGTVLTFKK